MVEIKLPKKGIRGKARIEAYFLFANGMIDLDNQMPHKVSARGWCYLLEGMNEITKNEFNYCEKVINNCRREGYIPLDFTATDVKRAFSNLETIEWVDPIDHIIKWAGWAKDCWKWKKDLDFWKTQEYYIQMAVEKVDVLNLFNPICERYHIPIANMVGWSDLNSRGAMCQRFKKAEEELGLKPILLYYGDYDPAGILIANFLKRNLDQLKKATKWNPENLIVDHFGLTLDFINQFNLVWIDNLITGTGRDLGKLYQKHLKGEKTNLKKYEIEYIEFNGVRKCEANSILPIANIAEVHCVDKITEYLGDNCFEKYEEGIDKIQEDVKDTMKQINYMERMTHLIVDLKAVKEDPLFTISKLEDNNEDS